MVETGGEIKLEAQNEALLQKVIAITEKAGKAIMEVYSLNDSETIYKEGGTPITRADMAAHNIIHEELTKVTPGLPVLSEESDSVS